MSELTIAGLQLHDATRLAQLTDLLDGPGQLSLEGEPIYADQAWNQFHSFTYGTIIPELTTSLEDAEPHLDVLFDDCTVETAPFNLAYYLEQITDAQTEPASMPVHALNESAMLDRASEWVRDLRAGGHTSQNQGITHLGGERPVALTTSSGRPACAVLDAVYQTQKAEAGIDTAVLVHSTDFRGQQLSMQAVLISVNDGLPFQQFANIYVRERKGLLRLAALQILSHTAELTEVR